MVPKFAMVLSVGSNPFCSDSLAAVKKTCHVGEGTRYKTLIIITTPISNKLVSSDLIADVFSLLSCMIFSIFMPSRMIPSHSQLLISDEVSILID